MQADPSLPPSALLQSLLHMKAAGDKAVMSKAAERSVEQGCCGLRTLLVRGRVMLG